MTLPIFDGLLKRRLDSFVSFAFAVAISMVVLTSESFANVESTSSKKWQKTLKDAQGKNVYLYAWGGSKSVNDYLRWVTRQVAKRYKVRLKHVKVADISEAVSRLKAENGRTSAIDLLWINGENFAYLKKQGLLLGHLWSSIPNVGLLATESLPISVDFGEPMAGFEVPWGIGQFNFIAEKAIFPQENVSAKSLLSIARQNPQTVTYPRPPEFHGTTFLKQLLIDLTSGDERLYQPANQQAEKELLAKLWEYLDELHPLLWREGKAFPSSAAEQLVLYQQQKLSMAVTFNPSQGEKEKNNKQISESSVRRHFADGAITNSHNLAIPKSAPNSEAAKVVIQFLLSEEAQTHKFEGSWGDPSVIKPLTRNRSTLPSQSELHSSWQLVIEEAWQQRYGA